MSWLAPGQAEAQSVTADGSFTYEIPIETPPATLGLKPQISLAYDSNNQNGLAGVGWTIKGLSMIYRDNAYRVDFNLLDQFCLDGNKLILEKIYTIPEQPNPVKHFHKEYEDYSHINHYDHTSSSSYWIVTHKNGYKYYYGNTTDSHINGVDKAGLAVVWALNKVEDPLGNYYTISYYEDTVGGDFYPYQIRYSDNDTYGIAGDVIIEFGYQGRTDHHVRYLPSKVDMGSLLSSITVSLADPDGTRPLRRYDLEYDPSGNTGRSLLKSVQEIGSGGGSLPAITFDWDEGGEIGFATPVEWDNETYERTWPYSGGTSSTPMDLRVGSIDMNSDGLPDRLKPRGTWTGVWEYDLAVKLSTGIGLGTQTDWITDDDWSATDGDWLIQRSNDNGEIYQMFLDMDGDHLPDRLSYHYSTTNGIHVGKNTGTGITLPPTKWLAANAWGYGGDQYPQSGDYSGSTSHLLVDMNGDDRPDRVASYYYGNGLYVGLNNGSTFATPTLWLGVNAWGGGTDNWPKIVNGEGTTFRTLMDMNGDGLPDRLSHYVTNSWGLHVGLNNGNGFDTPVDWLHAGAWGAAEDQYPEHGNIDGEIFRQLKDMNGDGLPDRLSCSYNNGSGNDLGLYVGLNNGHGFDTPTQWLDTYAWGNEEDRYPQSGDKGATIKTTLQDMNGDGLPDRLAYKKNDVNGLWVGINNGHGFNTPQNWNTNVWGVDPNYVKVFNDHFPRHGKDVGTTIYKMLLDVNGDGIPDRIGNYYDGNSGFHVALSKARLPDKMTGVNNRLGGAVSVDYLPASLVPDAILAGDHASANYSYGRVADTTPRYLVTKLTRNDGRSESSFSYKYFRGMMANGPLKDRVKLGFNYIDKVNDATGNYTRTVYNQVKPYQKLVGDIQNRDSSDNILTRKIFYYASRSDVGSPAGVLFVYQTNSYNYVYNGSNFVRTRQLFEYDAYGNVRRVYDYGQDYPTFDSDQSAALAEYIHNTTDWVLDKPKKATQNGLNINGDWVTQKQTQYYYDDLEYGSVGRGELTKKILLGTDYNVTIEHDYGARGNLLWTMDGNGNKTYSGYTTHYSADLSYVTNELDQTTSFYYDAYRRLKEEEDPNGVSTFHTYDQFSRPTKSYVTPDNLTYPTEERIYDFDGDFPECITTRQREEAGTDAVFETRTYYDGFGRVIQEKSETRILNQYNWEVVNYLYDSEGRLVRQSVPYHNTTGDYTAPAWYVGYTETEYDAAGRIVKITGPDGSATVTEYEGFTVTTTDPLNHVVSNRHDGLGNVVEVKEFLSTAPNEIEYANTLYEYNTGTNHLIKITDDKSNVITYTYDKLGHRTQMSHPDRGEWDYEYDHNGKVSSQTDGRNNTITYDHDKLDRPLSVNYTSGAGIQYHYDETGHGFGEGRLTSVDYPLGSESFTYDARGNVVRETVAIDGNARTEEFSFDSMNRLVELTYPDGEKVAYYYDPNGEINAVKGTDDYVRFINYLAGHRIQYASFGNFSSLSMTYYDLWSGDEDPSSGNRKLSQRLRRMVVDPDLMDITYQYDLAGNVKYKADNLGDIYSESLGYDHLNRLIWAGSPTYGFRGFAYDEIGNMTSKDGTTGTYTNHKLTSKNGVSYGYDDNGNMISAGGDQFWYDYENMMVLSNVGSSYTVYQYFGDRRVMKFNDGQTTYYFFPNYEEKVSADATKVLTGELPSSDALDESLVLPSGLRVDKAGGGGGGGQVEPDTLVTVVPDTVSTNVTPGSGKPGDDLELDYRFASPPVLVATINSEYGGDNCHHDISTVTADDFWARVEEDLSADVSHTYEALGYMAIEQGTYNVGLKKLHAGVVSAVHETWRSATFPQAFATTPVVVATIDTEAGGDNCHVDINSVTSSGFSVRVEEDLSCDGTHGASEDIGYLALEPGTYGVAGKTLVAARVSGVDHNWFQVTFPLTFPEIPVLVANINTEAGGQSCQIDIRSLTTNGFQVRCEEDMSCDGAHAEETIGYIVMEAGSFSDFGGSFLVNRVVMNHNWVEAVFPEPEIPTSSDGPVKYYDAGDMRVARRSEADGLVFIHGDHLGSASVLTSPSFALIKRVGYTPYGSDAYEVNLAGDAELDYKFTGQEQDGSGLYYYDSRYYDPSLGRFTTADNLISDLYSPQALNPYSYCNNNPVKYVDPSGNSILGAILVGAVVGGTVAYFSGDSILEGALTGALSGALCYYVSPFLGDLPGFAPLISDLVCNYAAGRVAANFTGDDAGRSDTGSGAGEGTPDGAGQAVPGLGVAGATGNFVKQVEFIAGGAAMKMMVHMARMQRGTFTRETISYEQVERARDWALIKAIEHGFDPDLARAEAMRSDGPSAGLLTKYMTEANLFAAFYHDIEYGATRKWASKRNPMNKDAFRSANDRLVANSVWYASTFGGNVPKSFYWGQVMKDGSNIGGQWAWRNQHLNALRRFPKSELMKPYRSSRGTRYR